jgi:hypothetical protein
MILLTHKVTAIGLFLPTLPLRVKSLNRFRRKGLNPVALDALVELFEHEADREWRARGRACLQTPTSSACWGAATRLLRSWLPGWQTDTASSIISKAMIACTSALQPAARPSTVYKSAPYACVVNFDPRGAARHIELPDDVEVRVWIARQSSATWFSRRPPGQKC